MYDPVASNVQRRLTCRESVVFHNTYSKYVNFNKNNDMEEKSTVEKKAIAKRKKRNLNRRGRKLRSTEAKSTRNTPSQQKRIPQSFCFGTFSFVLACFDFLMDDGGGTVLRRHAARRAAGNWSVGRREAGSVAGGRRQQERQPVGGERRVERGNRRGKVVMDGEKSGGQRVESGRRRGAGSAAVDGGGWYCGWSGVVNPRHRKACRRPLPLAQSLRPSHRLVC